MMNSGISAYKNTVSKIAGNSGYRVLQDRNGWISVYKGVNSDRSGQKELIRRNFDSAGNQYFAKNIPISDGKVKNIELSKTRVSFIMAKLKMVNFLDKIKTALR